MKTQAKTAESWTGKLLLILALVEGVPSANILALMTVPSHSHHLWNVKYLEALVERGHRVTYLGLDEYKSHPKNVTHVLVEGAYEFLYKDIDLISANDENPYRTVLLLREWDDLTTEFVAKSEALRRLIRSMRKEKFDLIVHDVGACLFLLGTADVAGRTPVVGITPFGVPPWAMEILGNPSPYPSNPHFYLPYSNDMSFLQRANNYLLHVFSSAVHRFHLRKQDGHSRRTFGNDVRPLDQILDDVNIIMVNSNHGTDYPLPKVPGLIPVGGLHIEDPKPLPQGLKTFLDEAKHGAVYFSLGSNIKSSLTKEKVDILMEAFGKITPVRVLWKLDSDFLQGKPENVKTEKWLPQNDILAHPNVRLFFTHSGLLSIQEAVYHGKPVVGMPFFLDQRFNLHKCVEKGFGEKLQYDTLTVDKIVETIGKVLRSPRYSENARRASVIFRDEMERPLDRAVYWTEYAIRHRGAGHLRHSSRNLSWYQNWMLDVLTLTVASASFILYSGYKLADAAISRIRRKNVPKLKAH